MKELGICLKSVDLNDYLSGSLPEKKKSEVEDHLRDCGACLERVVFAYDTVKEFNNKKGVKIMKPDWKKNLWLFGATLAFALSFFVPRYFVQLLVATILMALKWIFDSTNARILIMIYEAWKKGDGGETSTIFKTLNDRMTR